MGKQEVGGYVHFTSKFTANKGTFIPSADKPGYSINTTTVQDEFATSVMTALINAQANTTVNAVAWQNAGTSAHIDWQRTLLAIRVG